MTMPTFPVLGRLRPTQPDDEILASLRAGDTSAVAPFLDRFYGLAVRIASRYVSGRDGQALAWNALSDLAMELLEGRHRHARIEHALSYIATTVKHHVLALLRAEHRLGRRIHALCLMEQATIGQAVSQATYRAARGQSFDAADDAPRKPLPSFLTAPEVDMMTWLADGWTHQQIADELHIERDAAKKRIYRLKRRAQRDYALM